MTAHIHTGCPNKSTALVCCHSDLLKHFIWDTLYVLGQVRKVIICSNLILTAHISSTSRVRYCVLGPYSSWVWKKNEGKGILAMAMAKYCFSWPAKGFRKGQNVCDVYYIFDCNIVWKTLKEGKGKLIFYFKDSFILYSRCIQLPHDHTIDTRTSYHITCLLHTTFSYTYLLLEDIWWNNCILRGLTNVNPNKFHHQIWKEWVN